MIKFSIIIPVYNVSSYLNECIISVVNQTYKKYEIILVDDGSTDGSGQLCDEWKEKDERIFVIHQKNKGLSAARNTGIEIAKGDYIIFLDSDDLWKDNTVLNNIRLRLEKRNTDVLSFDFAKFSENDRQSPYFNKKNMPSEISSSELMEYLIRNDLWIACAWNKVIKRSLFDNGELRFVLNITSEDIDWCVRVALKAESFDYINDVVVLYRQRESSISKRITVQKMNMLFDNINRCLSIMNENKDRGAEVLQPYVGYQYGTALYSMAMLENKEDIKSLQKRAKEYRYLLTWSNNKKVKLLRIFSDIVGLKLTIMLLKICNKIR